jgi:phosphopantetheinyl transferase (holo-ACP synthase)
MPCESLASVLDLPGDTVPVGCDVIYAGVDLVDEKHLEQALQRWGRQLHRRIFAASERAAGTDPGTAAGLFGIKESVVKLAGGLPTGGRLMDIALDRSVSSGGLVRLTGALGDWAGEHRVQVVGGYAPVAPGLTLSWTLALRDGHEGTPC